jgi:hypothetical protein
VTLPLSYSRAQRLSSDCNLDGRWLGSVPFTRYSIGEPASQ